MNPTNEPTQPEEYQPFVDETCGDNLWDEVLAQPDPNPVARPVQPAKQQSTDIKSE
ncbi:hypothetical protein [Salmonirosea aquatica]|uniref:hypothetical protein n=1 Tax=Salmonirosea aquatica TaxID=2654236 RepID=UPI003570FB2D